jgi:hypothetical protein
MAKKTAAGCPRGAAKADGPAGAGFHLSAEGLLAALARGRKARAGGGAARAERGRRKGKQG